MRGAYRVYTGAYALLFFTVVRGDPMSSLLAVHSRMPNQGYNPSMGPLPKVVLLIMLRQWLVSVYDAKDTSLLLLI